MYSSDMKWEKIIREKTESDSSQCDSLAPDLSPSGIWENAHINFGMKWSRTWLVWKPRIAPRIATNAAKLRHKLMGGQLQIYPLLPSPPFACRVISQDSGLGMIKFGNGMADKKQNFQRNIVPDKNHFWNYSYADKFVLQTTSAKSVIQLIITLIYRSIVKSRTTFLLNALIVPDGNSQFKSTITRSYWPTIP